MVFWTHTVANRGTGWLNRSFHAAFREIALHAAIREQLFCPQYTLMPDHVHILWIGIANDSNQRLASRFLREHLEPQLHPHQWQHQPHDHVLRASERERSAVAATCAYIANNPVRAGLALVPSEWPYSGCIVPGYPGLTPAAADYWSKFWRLHNAAVERGRIGKMVGLQ